MKKEILEKLEAFKAELRKLKKEVSAVKSKRISRIGIRNQADAIATKWIEELRSPLEHKFNLPKEVIQETASQMKQLHILSRPNNLKTSYLKGINKALSQFDDRFILPIKQASIYVETVLNLQKLVPGLADPEESDYLREAIDCANTGFRRASVVMGWCVVIDKIQKRILVLGLEKFNNASRTIKNQKTGRHKNWNKEFSVATLADLQAVFDTDLIVVLEGMGHIDSNQVDRLRTCFQYRNHSAHPGQAPIEDAHLVAFFTDINAIVLQNPNFNL